VKTPILSLLDLCPIPAGSTPADAFRNSIDLARHAETWGYHRYWVAEHHNIPGIASAATSVVIEAIANATARMRIGAGGIMLPNHAPLVIAEQFGTLESLHPGRLDHGLGRAPGGDQKTARALRRGLGSSGDTFPQDLVELISYFSPDGSTTGVRAVPGMGLRVPVYLLGSSDFSARLAAQLGLPFAFASHFAPDYIDVALSLYRENFQPSETLNSPHAIVGVNLFAADTDAEANRLFTSLQQAFLNLIRGRPSELLPPVTSMDDRWNAQEQAHIARMTQFSIVGAPTAVRDGFEQLLTRTQADEIMVTGQIYDHAARLRSFEIGASVMKSA
jgi:luciferase family oxidoreductase group 1